MYNYKLLNNHYIVEIDNKHYILDTGYPYSITFRSDLNMVKVNGIYHALSAPGYRFDIKKTHKLVGYPVDGLLGLDVFGETGFTIYKDSEEGGHIDFASNDIRGITCPMVGFNIAPIINVNESKLFLVDTGARYAYGNRSVFVGLTPYSEVDDYNPTLGDLHSSIYHTEITIKNKRCQIDVCNNVQVASMISNIYMVGNITTLFEKECCVNYRDRKIIFN